MEYMFMPLRRYADFSGRSRRKEYWMFGLGLFILNIVLTMFLSLFVSSDPMDFSLFSGVGLILFLLVGLALFIPSLAVTVRRFHDQDKSGWFVLIGLIPYVGWLVVLVFMFIEGTAGTNRFGTDPKQVNPLN